MSCGVCVQQGSDDYGIYGLGTRRAEAYEAFHVGLRSSSGRRCRIWNLYGVENKSKHGHEERFTHRIICEQATLMSDFSPDLAPAYSSPGATYGHCFVPYVNTEFPLLTTHLDGPAPRFVNKEQYENLAYCFLDDAANACTQNV